MCITFQLRGYESNRSMSKFNITVLLRAFGYEKNMPCFSICQCFLVIFSNIGILTVKNVIHKQIQQ